MSDSYYDDQNYIRGLVDKGNHRAAIGGLWDQVGRLQFDSLCKAGLKPHHRLVDVGCGSLRGGVHFIPYLAPGHYFGTDVNESLITAGLTRELDADARARVPQDNFCISGDFQFGFGETRFDFAVAISLFTHLQQNTIELCLRRLRGHMVEGGQFQATFFLAPEDAPDTGLKQQDGIVSFPHKDPYHYTPAQIAGMAQRCGWQLQRVGPFGHPRGQQLAEFIARDPLPADTTAERIDMAQGAGDLEAASGFRLLCALGLRGTDRVLELTPARAAPLLRAYLAQGSHVAARPEALPPEGRFDFVLARDPASLPLAGLRGLLAQQGLLLTALPLAPGALRPLMREAGLVGRRLPWADPTPGLTWYVLAQTAAAVPGAGSDVALGGQTLREGR